MSQLVRKYRLNPDVRNVAAELVKDLPAKDYVAEVRAIHSFVRHNIRYLMDVRDVETIQTPDQLLFSRQGDCDDQALLVATLLETIGHPVRFKAIGFRPGVFQHVYAETLVGNRWLSVETTEDVNIGWQPSGVRALMIESW